MSRSRTWPWLVAAVVLGTVAIGMVGWNALRRGWLRFRPGPTLVLEIDSAHPFDDGVSRDDARRRTLEVLRNRIEKISSGVLTRVDGDRLEVVLPRDTPAELASRVLTRTGRLEFKLVDDGADYMKQIAGLVEAMPSDVDIAVGHDSWNETSSAAHHEDVYLRSSDRAALLGVWNAVTEKLPLPADHAVAFQEFEGRDENWRSYYLFARTDVTGDNIMDAEVNWDAQTGRPEVSLTLDKDGATRFEALSARAVGRKLAILLEGHVNAAPVVESKIAGGHVRITMGGSSDPYHLQQEAKDLTAVLRSGSTAAPVRLVEVRPPLSR